MDFFKLNFNIQLFKTIKVQAMSRELGLRL